MATVFLTYSYVDAKGATASNRINFPANVDIDQLKGFAVSTGLLIDTVTRCKIVGIGIGIEVDLVGAFKGAAIANSDVEEGARFAWNTDAFTLTSFRIPGFDEAFINSSSRNVDLTNTSVNALVQRILAGQTTGLINVSPSDASGNDVVSIATALESFQKSRT